jgi:hypothetical protein
MRIAITRALALAESSRAVLAPRGPIVFAARADGLAAFLAGSKH